MSDDPVTGKPQKAGVIAFKPRKSDTLAPLNFKVPRQFRHEFKLFAIEEGMSMVALLQASFKLMKSQRKR
ncbi:MAG: hypothetical protein ABL967_01485 [Bryobacteraceae bacterium]